jgi:hypothetical protein
VHTFWGLVALWCKSITDVIYYQKWAEKTCNLNFRQNTLCGSVCLEGEPNILYAHLKLKFKYSVHKVYIKNTLHTLCILINHNGILDDS